MEPVSTYNLLFKFILQWDWCTLFSENSLEHPTALHPDYSVEPRNISTITYMRRVTVTAKYAPRLLDNVLQDVQLDSFFPDKDRFDDETSFTLVTDRYAVIIIN
ncbi:hypothetical protein KIN20_020323 [Parelaphostrongylus tenuis]|uniref:Uncharacterized protein n=1 Tax=Parelaphostrongylus tenuis TaxID=148309 RepID=A0AAD5QTF8_PARTN|nr:hypothetical protein KIN20_020323 [Parelaphostrongylus tenuis]